MQSFTKDPDAVLDYTVDWSAWLQAGETITASQWITPDGITQGSGAQAPSNTTTTATVWLLAGTLGQTYIVTNRVTTSDGRVDDRSLRITISNQ